MKEREKERERERERKTEREKEIERERERETAGALYARAASYKPNSSGLTNLTKFDVSLFMANFFLVTHFSFCTFNIMRSVHICHDISAVKWQQ
jgi:hypothetical protein